jgi:amiloride-sensitive sodium channel
VSQLYNQLVQFCLQVKDVSVRQRKCRFSDESDLDVYPYYSYSSCCVQCRKDAQKRICGCAHHLMPNTGDFSPLSGPH